MNEESRKRSQSIPKEDVTKEMDEKKKRIARENRLKKNSLRKEGKELMRTANTDPCQILFE